jgi:hypothetical protein
MDEPQNRFTKEQKIGLILLSAFVILAVALGLVEMRNTLYGPFALNSSVPSMIGEDLDTEEALRYRDTDSDGLTDFDELYVYSTSPYLVDTDSDGLTDLEEIESGKNPSCAEGKDCYSSIVENASAVPSTTTTEDTADDGTSLDIMDYTEDEISATFESLVYSPDTMRELLIDAGLSESIVEQISDDELVEMATEIFTSSTLWSEIESATTTADASSTAAFINQLMETE